MSEKIMKRPGTRKDRATEAFLLQKCVDIAYIEDGPRYIVGSGDKRMGQRGQLVATVGIKHGGGYVVVLNLDNGKLDSFNPMGVFLEPEQKPA